jgi:hypothetical protein
MQTHYSAGAKKKRDLPKMYLERAPESECRAKFSQSQPAKASIAP